MRSGALIDQIEFVFHDGTSVAYGNYGGDQRNDFVLNEGEFLVKVHCREGSSLGFVLAAGSVGAIFGAILAGFLALPLIGATATFAACGALALLRSSRILRYWPSCWCGGTIIRRFATQTTHATQQRSGCVRSS